MEVWNSHTGSDGDFARSPYPTRRRHQMSLEVASTSMMVAGEVTISKGGDDNGGHRFSRQFWVGIIVGSGFTMSISLFPISNHLRVGKM